MKKDIRSVSQINRMIKDMFDREYELSVVFVQGEVSNCKYHSSGHIYFSLKDASSQISCVMFRGDRRGLDFDIENGMEIIVAGEISVYERDGRYQLYAKRIKASGEGALAEKFEKLKRKLENAGYFDTEHKKDIPPYVRTVGIVTAKTGAAIQDIINISTRRNPYVQLILYPAKVQGDGAAVSIAKGIKRLDGMDTDVIIVGRGGGSAEDLWAFNEEVVADAIYECDTPIISAVGHETDTSISDFVADMRAPTPSAAAELAIYEVDDVLDVLDGYEERMMRVMFTFIELARSRLNSDKVRLQLRSPESILRQHRQYLDSAHESLISHMERVVTGCRHSLEICAKRLDGVSPLKRLQSGYAYFSTVDGKRISSIEDIDTSDKVMMTISDGRVYATVDTTEKIKEI